MKLFGRGSSRGLPGKAAAKYRKTLPKNSLSKILACKAARRALLHVLQVVCEMLLGTTNIHKC